MLAHFLFAGHVATQERAAAELQRRDEPGREAEAG
jgi:hypothetical protein